MQFPESWLREFCNPPLTTEQIADTLTMAGLDLPERSVRSANRNPTRRKKPR